MRIVFLHMHNTIYAVDWYIAYVVSKRKDTNTHIIYIYIYVRYMCKNNIHAYTLTTCLKKTNTNSQRDLFLPSVYTHYKNHKYI